MGNAKPGSRPHVQVEAAKRHQKRRYGTVDAASVVAAAPRARKRAVKLEQKDAVEETVQAADLESKLNLAKWVDRGISLKTLKDVIDPKSEEEFALLAAALRSGKPLATFREQLARSRRRVERDKKLRAAGAALRDKDGFSATYVKRVLNGAGGVTLQTRDVVQTGVQVRAKRKRDRAVKLLPKQKRPTYASQTTIGHGLRFLGAGSKKRVVKSKHARGPPSKRSQAEINDKAQRVTGPDSRGRYRMKIPRSLWSDGDLARMGFRPRDKPKRDFDFKGPTAKDDARAFDDKMMKWLKNPNRVGPPPHLRKS